MSLRSLAQGLLEAEARWSQEPRRPRGLPTGLAGLDSLTLGLRPREVTILAARTSHGKSSLALTIAVNALKWEILQSRRDGRIPGRVLYLSPEMHPEQLLMRLASMESRVDLEQIVEGTASPDMRRRWRRVLEVLPQFDGLLEIVGGRGMDAEEVVSSIRSAQVERPLVLVVIDYLQRITYGIVDDEYRRISLLSQLMKDLANELAVPFLVVSQLNRQIERDRHQSDRLPDLSDLRGSGRLEEDADNVWLLWRPPRLTAEVSSAPQEAKLVVAKARSGRVGEVSLWFYPRLVSFVDAGPSRVRADGGVSPYSVAGEPLPTLVDLAGDEEIEAEETVVVAEDDEEGEEGGEEEDDSLLEEHDPERLWQHIVAELLPMEVAPAEGSNGKVAWFFAPGSGQRGPPERSRRRGADFERRLARRLGTYRWPGLDGDIEWNGWRIECKYRDGLVLDSRSELKYWLEQVYTYAEAWPEGKRWCIAITGGRAYRKGAVYVLLPLEFWLEVVGAGRTG